MADAHGSGPCVRKDVGVQLPPRPHAPGDPCPRKARTGVASCWPRGRAPRARVPGSGWGPLRSHVRFGGPSRGRLPLGRWCSPASASVPGPPPRVPAFRSGVGPGGRFAVARAVAPAVPCAVGFRSGGGQPRTASFRGRPRVPAFRSGGRPPRLLALAVACPRPVPLVRRPPRPEPVPRSPPRIQVFYGAAGPRTPASGAGAGRSSRRAPAPRCVSCRCGPRGAAGFVGALGRLGGALRGRGGGWDSWGGAGGGAVRSRASGPRCRRRWWGFGCRWGWLAAAGGRVRCACCWGSGAGAGSGSDRLYE